MDRLLDEVRLGGPGSWLERIKRFRGAAGEA